MKSGTEYLNYGRDIIAGWGGHHLSHQLRSEKGKVKVFDLGCGHGTDLINTRQATHVERSDDAARITLMGVEHYPPYIQECRKEGIETFALDIERDPFPQNSGTLDLVIANQILEHTKEIFWIFSEAVRTLKPGGLFLVGVPNLASFHNRVLLLFGKQPTQIQSMSAHVRGFTYPDLKSFAETGGYFRCTENRGSNFYPLPPAFAKPLSRLFPKMAWGMFLRLERTGKSGDFLECLSGDDNFLETPFYGSPQNPPRRVSQSTASTSSKSKLTTTRKRATKKG